MPEPSAPVESRRRVDRDALDAAVTGYRRTERVASWTLALLAAGAFLAAVAAFSLWHGAAVALVLAVALRAPVLRRGGTTRLRTDGPPEEVTEAFASATPPVLALQWGVADEVRPASDGAGGVYEHEWLLGLRSHSLTVDTEAEPSDGASAADGDPAARVLIEGTLDGRPWGAYAAAVREAADGTAGRTVVDVELCPRRRFGLRSLPQTLVAERYYADALAAQGYETVSRDVSFAVSSTAPRS
ncbi:hypothetical protein [Halorubrum sodomense]|uniref:Uncharacterized protein n=1 Tax=Halorubrum sodomense TaxID=35743 RepID=A0A1I6FM81_HALSD|nr:hypothetical protein [Halorubrum sodomense]SFR31062.1 hypothetical protein SAMN04487937_0900 [Halorubrum sodomense]